MLFRRREMEGLKRFFGLIKTPTQLVEKMHFEFRVMDGEETTEKPRKVIMFVSVEICRFCVAYHK